MAYSLLQLNLHNFHNALFYFLFLMGVFVFFFLIEVLGLIGLLKTVLSEEMMYIFFFAENLAKSDK